MHENKNTTLSFARIGTFLLFSIVLITASFLVVYIFLSSQQTQNAQSQPPLAYQKIVPYTAQYPTIDYVPDNKSLSPTQIPINNPPNTMGKYISPDFKIQFEYPKNQLRGPTYIAVTNGIIFYSTSPIDANGTTYSISVNELKNPKKLPLKQLVEANLPNEVRGHYTYSQISGPNYIYKRESKIEDKNFRSGTLAYYIAYFTNVDRYIVLTLKPYMKNYPFPMQDKFFEIFNGIAQSIRFLGKNNKPINIGSITTIN